MRTLLVALANDVHSKLMFTWLLENELQPDDQLHMLHVSLRDASNGALPHSDYFEQAHPAAAHRQVQEMLHTQFVALLQATFPGLHYVVHNVQASQDNKTVGRIICEKAQQLKADQVFLGGSGSHHSKMAEILAGSVVTHVKKHLGQVPLTVVVQQGTGMAAEAAS